MPRYCLKIEYNGQAYNGYQAQTDLPSVQASIERAIFAFSGQALRITAAGRTDAGVHALGQVVSFDLDKDFRPQVVRDAINAHLLPEPICVLSAQLVDDDFSARFSATGRMYLYRISNRRAPPCLDKGRVWHVKKPLDEVAMQNAAQHLLGEHDFTTFRHVECQAKSPIRSLSLARVARFGDEIHLVFAARSFLHRQVRSMAGSLAEVGAGRWQVDDIRNALQAKDRKACGQVAPSDGLYLTHVTYEEEPNFETFSSISSQDA